MYWPNHQSIGVAICESNPPFLSSQLQESSPAQIHLPHQTEGQWCLIYIDWPDDINSELRYHGYPTGDVQETVPRVTLPYDGNSDLSCSLFTSEQPYYPPDPHKTTVTIWVNDKSQCESCFEFSLCVYRVISLTQMYSTYVAFKICKLMKILD